MIEKITNQNQIARHKLAEKINELIDTVNDIHFEDVPILTKKELKALAEATATMLADKSNTIITVILNKDGKPVFITR